MDKIEAKLAFDIGTNFYGQGNFKKALPYYKKALNLFKSLDNEKKEADILLKMGDICTEIENPDEALNYYESSLKIYSKNNDVMGEGYALTGLGLVFEMYHDYEKSRNYYENAIEKFQLCGDYKRAGMVSNLIAHSHEQQDAFEDAILDYKRSRELFGKVKDHAREQKINETISNLENKRFKINSSKKELTTLMGYLVSKKELIILIGYLVAIAAAELLTTYFNFKVGLVAHVSILFALLINSSLAQSYNFSNLLRSMMVLPMIRIVGLSIPIMQIPTLYWFPIIAIPLFAASYTLMRNQRLNRKKVGLILGNIPVQIIIALSGIILGFTEYLILKPDPLISTFSIVPLITGFIILTISTGFAEELLFRGILQRNAENVFGKLFGLLYASLLFTCLHIGWNSFLDLAFVFGVAIFYGYMFQKTRSIVGITLSHGLSNSVLFLIMPFVVFQLPF
ncbi:MAG: tetratricopeptide repeat protein [Methanobacterium sp.]